MKRSLSMKDLNSISQLNIPFHSLMHTHTVRKSFSVGAFHETEHHQPSMIRSPSSMSFKISNFESQNFVDDDTADGDPVSSKESHFVHFGMERVSVSLSALDKETEKAHCTGRSLSVGERTLSVPRNLDLHDKSDKIPHFCEDLSTVMKDPSFEPSFSYFISRHNSSSDHGSICSEVNDSRDTEYTSVDAVTVKGGQDWQTAANFSESIELVEELPCRRDLDRENPPRLYTAIGSALNFATRIIAVPKTVPKDEVDVKELVQELEREPDLNEIQLKNRCIMEPIDSSAACLISSTPSLDKFITTLSGSSRELSVISERSDGQFGMDETYNSDGASMDEPGALATNFDENGRNGNLISERAVVVDSTVPKHRRWLSEERNVKKKVFNLEMGMKREQLAPLRLPSSRNGELSARCRSQVVLEEENDYINWSGAEENKSKKNLSSSTPTVSEEVPSPTEQDRAKEVEARKRQRRRDIERKGNYKWKEALPATFGPHQVLGPIQRASRTPVNGSTREAPFSSARNGKKARVEKKHSRKTSTLLDFFRKPDLRSFSDVVTPIADRRSTVSEGFDGSSDIFAKALLDKLPNTIGVTDGRHLAAHFNKGTQRFVPQMNKPRWSDLDLWGEEPATWSSSNSTIRLSKKERKKQDIIHELYLTEKHHCQVLVILQQVYQEGLRINDIVDEAKRNQLIPSVLDSLLDFHLNFLRQLRQKRLESVVVDSIASIIYSEFEKGERNRAAIHAYTEFCSKYNQCGRLYDEWMLKNIELKKFFDQYEQDPTYKGRTFKMCLLLIAQRLTKYPVLVEKISEMESGAAKEESLRAHAAVKKFAMHVNNEIAKLEVNRRWDRIRSNIDHSSKGRFGPNDLFTYDDLILNGSDEERCVICIGGAVCQNSQKKTAEGTEVMLVLFDDILIMLANSNNKYVFHDRGSGSSVIALSQLIVREVPRSTSLFFLVADDPCPDLIVMSFASKTDVEQWKRAVEASKSMAPKHVRRATVTSALNLTDEDPEEKRLTQEIASWEEKLRELFDKRIKDERELSYYIEKRLKWFEQLRSHIRKIPVMDRTDTNRNSLREKVKGLVKQKFAELRAARQSSLSRVAERAENMYEDDFISFFDDIYDAGAGTSDSNHSTDQSESDETRQKLPRRNRTFSGIGERKKGGSVRRHTTEPKMAEARSYGEKHDSSVEEEEMRKLPLLLGPMARRAAVSIIRENAQLRVENNRLQSEIAFRELRIASLRSRRLAAIPANALEALRNKQNELQNDKREFQIFCELHVDEINRRTAALLEKEGELKVREEQLQEQWIKFYEMNSSDSPTQRAVSGMMRSVNSTSPLDRSVSVRSVSLSKSTSGSSMPLHLAEKTAKISRSKK